MSKDYGVNDIGYGGSDNDTSHVSIPMSLSNQTNTTLKRERAWKSVGGVLSAQNFGSVQSFDDQSPTQVPASDKGANS